MAAVTIHNDFGAQENKTCHCLYFFLIFSPWSVIVNIINEKETLKNLLKLTGHVDQTMKNNFHSKFDSV